MADKVSLDFLARQLERVLDEMRIMRRDLDMLTRIVLRLDSTVDAPREDIKSLWLTQSDLRRRIESDVAGSEAQTRRPNSRHRQVVTER